MSIGLRRRVDLDRLDSRAVVVQARRGNWLEKRQTYRSRASATFIEHHADRAAAREAEVRDHAIEAIDEAITKFRADLQATETTLIGR